MDRARPQPAAQTSRRRKSVFMEVGLMDEATMRRERSPAPTQLPLGRTVRFRTRHDILGERETDHSEEAREWELASDTDDADCEELATTKLPPSQPMFTNSKMYRLGLLALVFALMLPVLQSSPVNRVKAKAGAGPRHTIDPYIAKREDTNTDVCKRWSHQSTIVNGTLYVYGGQAITSGDQKTDTWTNDFLTLDLTKSWQTSKPSFSGLPRPDGPPKVSNAYLWNSHDSLFLYGGEFADNPIDNPTAFSTWEYQIGSKQWVEHKDPKTSAGKNAPEDGQPVQRSAEGAGVGVSTLGRGWYFGGHLDEHTTEGWSNQIKRVYLKGLLEFTFPGASNDAVDSLTDGKTAGEDGVYRNITEGGMQDTSGFTERADGLLLYVPGFGDEGILLGLTGGTEEKFTQMNVIDVFDIANSQWYKQSTSGNKIPKYRVNPCAVVAAAADGSSYNVYMFGGQNLTPAGNQTQYDDMWILSVPSFKWIEVDPEKSGQPPYPRAGHSCHVWDSQMIVVGGYIGQEIQCESPGVYVFNMSSLQWGEQFTALTGNRVHQSFDGSENSGNPLAQQANQRGFNSTAGLEGSYGYNVPDEVQTVIGGKATGGATLTAPVQTVTEGPFATGKPITYTVTGPNGAIITETTTVPAASSGGGTNIGAIVAGVIAGLFAILAGYMAFCAWIYRKQVKIWKAHAAAVTTRAANEKHDPFAAQGAIATSSSAGKNSSDRAARDALFPPGDTSSSGGVRTSEDRIGYAGAAGVAGHGSLGTGGRRNSDDSSEEDLLAGQEPSFWGTKGVLLNPRRSLRVINRD